MQSEIASELDNGLADYNDCQKSLRFGFDTERPGIRKSYPGSILQPGFSNSRHGLLNLAMEIRCSPDLHQSDIVL